MWLDKKIGEIESALKKYLTDSYLSILKNEAIPQNMDDLDRQVLIEGLGPEAFLMGGLPIDMAEELGVQNEVPAECLETANVPKKQSKLGTYILLGLGLTALGAGAYLGLQNFNKDTQAGKSITSQFEQDQPQVAPQEPSYQTQPQGDKGIVGSTLETLEEEKAKREIETTAYAFEKAINNDIKNAYNYMCATQRDGLKVIEGSGATLLIKNIKIMKQSNIIYGEVFGEWKFSIDPTQNYEGRIGFINKIDDKYCIFLKP